uniref:DRBM domain-containing protein n=1 Tax=Mesocestoides corti TaxID=53468 RepID=A0A5K3F1Q4_MESCO
MLLKVPVRKIKIGVDFGVSFGGCDFFSPIGHEEASFKALCVIRSAVEMTNTIATQSFEWRLSILSYLQDISPAYKTVKHPSQCKVLVSCTVHPLLTMEASSKTLERTRERAARLMFNRLKGGGWTTSPSLQNLKKNLRTVPKKREDVSRGSEKYMGSLHPVERLDLNCRARGARAPVYTEEKQLTWFPQSTPTHRAKPLNPKCPLMKFRYLCQLGDAVILGTTCNNKRLAKRAAAEMALQWLGINPYPGVTPLASTSILHQSAQEYQRTNVKEMTVTFSSTKETFIFDSVFPSSAEFHLRNHTKKSHDFWKKSGHARAISRFCRPSASRKISRATGVTQLCGEYSETQESAKDLYAELKKFFSYDHDQEGVHHPEQISRASLPPQVEAISWHILSHLSHLLTCPTIDPDVDPQLLPVCEHLGAPCGSPVIHAVRFARHGTTLHEVSTLVFGEDCRYSFAKSTTLLPKYN